MSRAPLTARQAPAELSGNVWVWLTCAEARALRLAATFGDYPVEVLNQLRSAVT